MMVVITETGDLQVASASLLSCLFNHMDVEGGICLVTSNWFEVSVDGMLCKGPKNTLEEAAEVIKAVRIV